MFRSPSEIRDRWLNYGPQYAVNRWAWDGSLAFASGPLGHEGGTLRDYSGRGNHGTLIASPTLASESIRGGSFQATQFAGGGPCVDIYHESLKLVSGSVSFWFRGTADAWTSGAAFAMGDTDGPEWFAIGLGDGATSFLENELLTILTGSESDVTENRICYSTTDRNEVFNGAWHHLCVNCGNQYKLWLDGINCELNVASGANDGKFTNKAGIDNGYIAARSVVNAGIGNTLAGAVAGFRITSRVQTPNEIATLARHPLVVYEVEVPRYWTFPLTSTAKPWLYARTSSQIIGGGIA